MEALLEAVHENLPSDTIEDADILQLGHDALEALAACAKTDAAQAKQRLVPLYDVGGALAGKLLPVERTSDDVEDYLSSDASEAKKQLEEAEAAKKTAETALRDAQKILDNDAGPDGAYHVLRERCFSVKPSRTTRLWETSASGAPTTRSGTSAAASTAR